VKIALTGAHGVGKSTLAHFLKEELGKFNKAARVTPEVPRLICDFVGDREYFRRGKNTILKQALILIGQLVIEAEQRKADSLQICDRTLLDHWAYTLHAFKEELAAQDLLEVYETFTVRHCATYDKIFYIPNEVQPVDDGTREADLLFQAEIDRLIVDLMDKHGLAYTTITGTTERRAAQVQSFLEL
jgi:nicotinamide riboside kinase